MKGRLWGWASLFMEAQLGNLEWAHLLGTLRYGWKGLWRGSVSLCGSSVKGTWREGTLAGDPEGYVEKALKTGISFHRGPVWGTWRRSRLLGTLRDWWRRLWGVQHLSLKRLCGGGLGGSSFTGDLGRYVKKVSRCWHLSPWGPLSTWGEPRICWGGGACIPGTLIGCRSSVRGAPFWGSGRTWGWSVSLYLYLSLSEDSMKGTLREGSFIGELERWGFWEICKMPCKWASLFIGALLGNLEGVHLPGLLREKKSISGFLSWTLKPLRF